MKSGDRLIIYETGDRKSAVGTASVVSIKVTDPKNPQMELAAGKELPKPITPRRNQGQQTLRRVAPGENGPPLGRSAYSRTVQIFAGRLIPRDP